MGDDQFADEKERLEEKHRLEVLNLLRSFEFERKDFESRLQARLQEKDHDRSYDTDIFLKEFEDFDEKLGSADDDVRRKFEQVKEEFLKRIKQLENEVLKRGKEENHKGKEDESVDRSTAQLEADILEYNNENREDGRKSLSELEEDNEKLKMELGDQRNRVIELQNHMRTLNAKLDDIKVIVNNEMDSSEDKNKIMKILDDGFIKPSNEMTERKESETLNKESPSRNTNDFSEEQSGSLASFQIDELNIENDELKEKVCEIEKKIRKTVEEYELQRKVFKENLEGILKDLEGQEEGEDKTNAGIHEEKLTLLKELKLVETPKELLEEYVKLVLSEDIGSKTPDLFELSLLQEIRSLESLLDIEIFDGRVFDEEMKDEVGEVLREKERELMVAYVMEKFRVELRHRYDIESVMKELQKEREKEYKVHQATNEVLKKHLGISGDEPDPVENKEEGPEFVDEKEKVVETLKAEKEQLENTLKELQDNFKSEKEEWLNNLQGLAKDDSEGTDREKVIQSLNAQKLLLEQVLTAERFYLGRLYYHEMREELESTAKQQLERSGKYEKERINQAWKHHAEVGNLYENILTKEAESLERMKEDKRDQPGAADVPGTSAGELRNKAALLEDLLPVKRELVDLQRNRCREHKIASLILEQAVNALEIAVKESDSLLVTGDPLHHHLNWGTSEEDYTLDSSADVHVSQGEDVSEKSDVDGSSDIVDGKVALRKALEGILQNLLQQQRPTQEQEAMSYSSDSDVNEELGAKDTIDKDKDEQPEHENTKDREERPSNDKTSQLSGSETGEATKSKKEKLKEKQKKSSSPELFSVPDNIQHVWNVELFNLSRLFRDEYMDKVHRNRKRVHQMKAFNTNKNEEVLAKFREQVAALLAKTNLGKIEKEGISDKQAKLAAMPSDDSGIAEFSEADKDEIVKKYKVLLEKARKDLNRAQKKLQKTPKGVNDLNNEVDQMRKNLKEKMDDLEEIEEKRAGVDDEQRVLLEKIQSVAAPSTRDKDKETEHKPEDKAKPVEPDVSTHSDATEEQDNRPSVGLVIRDDISESMGTTDAMKDEEIEDLRKKVGELKNEIDEQMQKFEEEDRIKQEKINDLQRKLVDGTGGEDILNDLQKELNKAKEEKRNLEAKCSELEKNADLQNEEKAKQGDGDIQKIKNENAALENENKEKQEKIEELQKKFVEGTDGKDILKGLQVELTELREENKDLKKEKEDLQGTEGLDKKDIAKLQNEKSDLEQKVAEMEREMDKQNGKFEEEDRIKQDKIDELQRKLVDGTGGEEILNGLQKELNETKEEKRNLEDKCSELEKKAALENEEKAKQGDGDIQQIKNENTALENENREKQEKIEELQTKLVEGTDGKDILKGLQDELNKLHEENKKLKKENEDLQGTESLGDKDVAKLQNEKCDLEQKVAKMEREMDKQNGKFEEEDRIKQGKIDELQRKLVDGTGGEDILNDLQKELNEAKEEKRNLEAKCSELEKKAALENEEKAKQGDGDMQKIKNENAALENENREKQEKIEELQTKLVEGTDGKDILKGLQDELNKLHEENKKLKKENEDLQGTESLGDKDVAKIQNEKCDLEQKVAKMEREMDKQNGKFEEEDRIKQGKIDELQRKLVGGTGGEDILNDLQKELNETKEEKRNLEAKCSELEKKAALENEEKAKQGDGDMQKIKNENAALENENREKQEKIEELQTKLVEGTDGKGILKGLQDDLTELREENKKLKKEKEDLQGTEGLDNKDITKLQNEKSELEQKVGEMEREMDKQNGKFEKEDRIKKDKIDELQRKLVDGTGGEEILNDLQKELKALQQQLKQLKGDNEKLEKRCKDLDDLAQHSDDKKRNLKLERDNSKLRDENSYLVQENKAKADEIRDLQKALVDGSGGEDVLENLQDKLEELEKTRKILQKECQDLDASRKDLQAREVELRKENEEIEGVVARLRKENDYLERESDAKTGEILKLQEKLLNGAGGTDILKDLQDQITQLEKENRELKKTCIDLESAVDEQKKQIEECADKRVADDLSSQGSQSENNVEGEGLVQSSMDKTGEPNGKERTGGTKPSGVSNAVDEGTSSVGQKGETSTAGELKHRLNKLHKEYEEKMEEVEVKEEERGKLERKLAKVTEENSHLTEENKAKSEEIMKLREKMFDGSGHEEVLKELQDKIQELEELNKALRNKCWEIESRDRGPKEINKQKRSEDSEKSDYEGEVRGDKWDDGACRDNEERTRENETMRGTSVDIAKDQEVSSAEDKLEGDLRQLQLENDNLMNQVKEKDAEICGLRNALVEGSGGEIVLRDLQSKLDNEKGKNEDLEKKLKNMKDSVSREDGSGNAVSEMEESEMEEDRTSLKKIIEKQDQKINKLQEDILKGSGSEDVLRELKDEVEKLKKENETLTTSAKESGSKANEMSVGEINELKDELEKLKDGNKSKENEISELQRKIIDGTGQEEVLGSLQEQIGELRHQNEELSKELGEMQKENLKNDPRKLQDENHEVLRKRNEELETARDNDRQRICELQRQLAEGSGMEGFLGELQDDVKRLQKENDKLREQNEEGRTHARVESGKEYFDNLERKKQELENDIEQLSKEVDRLQKQLVDGTGGEIVPQELQDKVKDLEKRNKELQKPKQDSVKDYDDVGKKKSSDDHGEGTNELKKLRKSVKKLGKESSRQKDQIIRLERKASPDPEKQAPKTVQEQLKNLEDGSTELKSRCEDVENEIENLLGEQSLQKDKEDHVKDETIKPQADTNDKLPEVRKQDAPSCVVISKKDTANQKRTEGIPTEDDESFSQKLDRLRKELSGLEELKKNNEDTIKELRKELLDSEELEEEVQALRDQLKNCEEKITSLEEERSNLDEAINQLRKENQKLSKDGKANIGSSTSQPIRQIKKNDLDKSMEGLPSKSGEGDDEVITENNLGKTIDTDERPDFPSHEECLELIPHLCEERDHWKEKYGALRDKVGAPFVDMIPEVWKEETDLEKEREKTQSRLSELQKTMEEKRTPLLKNWTDKERFGKELEDIEGQLQDCNEELSHIKDLHKRKDKIEGQQSVLRTCLENLEAGCGGMDEEVSPGGSANDNRQDGVEAAVSQDDIQEKIDKLRHATDILLAEAQKDSTKQSENLKDVKIKIIKEIQDLEQAIDELQPTFSGTNTKGVKPSKTEPELEEAQKETDETPTVETELQNIDREVNDLQLYLEDFNASTKREVDALVGLIKEKSQLEDEYGTAERALGQLSKRDRENLMKERAKQEKVAKRLLQLTHEKQVAENELQEIQGLVRAKETELISCLERYKSEGPEASVTEKQKGKKRKGKSREKDTDDSSAGISSTDESIEGRVEDENASSSEEIVDLSEKLGALIQTRSSLDVRLESLGKQITAQSQKVEKSLLTAREHPTEEALPGEMSPGERSPSQISSGGTTLASSFTSISDLTQSQLSLFDDRGFVDDVSLATNIVRSEMVRRKSSRKAPMAKLLKEKTGLEKKLKELEGRILVQNAKIRNALREGKDPSKARAKFVEAMEERKKYEGDLQDVLNRIEECKTENDGFTGKNRKEEKKGSQEKLEKSGKSLSKNDKRRLLSQKDSLAKQLERVQKRIEVYNLDDGLEDFPEMAEENSVGRAVERLRELLEREAQLKQGIEGAPLKPSGGRKKHGSPLHNVVEVLKNEKANKEARLIDMEHDEKTERSDKNHKNLKKNIKDLKKNVEETLKKLNEEEEQVMNGLDIMEEDTAENSLMQEIDDLQNKKKELERQLEQIEDFFGSQAELEPVNEITKQYQEYSELEKEEKDLERQLRDVNEKLLERKEWAEPVDENAVTTDDTDSKLTESYGEILRRMEDEHLNMADLIRELELTQETLSREREITGELLDLIKSRVGNELMEALTGDGLVSPSAEITANVPSDKDVADKVEHDNVTVAEIIAEYKKMNEAAMRENQQLNEMMSSLKQKLDEDLFDSIIDEDVSGADTSKKIALSKILENNKTIFEQMSENEKEKTEMGKLMTENSSSKENIEQLEEKLGCITKELEDLKLEKRELERKVEEAEEDNVATEKETGVSSDKIQKGTDELHSKLEHAEKENHDLEEQLAGLKDEKHAFDEILAAVEEEKNEVVLKLEDITKQNDQFKRELEKKGKIEEELELVKQGLSSIEKERDDLLSKLEEINEIRDELEEKLKAEDKAKEENKILKERLTEFEKNEEEGEVDKQKSGVDGLGNNSKTEDLKRLEELTKENSALREAVGVLEKENDQINTTIEELGKAKEELQDEVESLQKENKELETLYENQESLKNELGQLKAERDEVVEYIEKELGGNVASGIKETLEEHNKSLKEREQEYDVINKQMGKLKDILGENLSETLLELELHGPLQDTSDTPRCLEDILKDQVTLGTIMARNDTEECDREFLEIVKPYENLLKADYPENEKNGDEKVHDEVPVSEDGGAKHHEERPVETMKASKQHDVSAPKVAPVDGEEVEFQPSRDGKDDDEEMKPLDMELEYKDLLKKVVEHQDDIEEAEEMLRDQKRKYEEEKKALVEKFCNEQATTQKQIDAERKSMEKAMQNLINEIVRLKEERTEIRKNSRLEREKMEGLFDKERLELSAASEAAKAEVKKEVEKACSDVFEKEKRIMEQKEEELKEEIDKLRNEKKEAEAKLKEVEGKIPMEKEMPFVPQPRDTEASGRVRKEFEDTLKKEKQKFQGTLTALKDDIDRLQKERSNLLKETPSVADVLDIPSPSAYERLACEYREKLQSQKATLEKRIKDLRSEKEELNRQKQETKRDMRKQRLEINRKHEKEKNDLTEKHRNEITLLRNKLQKKREDEQNAESSNLAKSLGDIFELQQQLREKDGQLRRYERFFRELNREASTMQKDPAMVE